MNLNNVTSNLSLTDAEIVKIEKCINHYSEDNTTSNLGYRIWNAIKHIFGQSDWQVAKKIIRKSSLKHMNIEGMPQYVRNQRTEDFALYVLKYLTTQKTVETNNHQYLISKEDWEKEKDTDFAKIFSKLTNVPFINDPWELPRWMDNLYVCVNKLNEMYNKIR